MQSDILIKVCGMKSPHQIAELASYDIQYIGLIFHAGSPRYVSEWIDASVFGGKKVIGVFVNAPMEEVLYAVSRYQLAGVQLHGQESPEYCASLQVKGIEVIKAFSVDKSFDFSKVLDYDGYADLFLFDAKGDAAGGNGIRFDWKKLEEYEGATPFLLSGGIGENHLDEIRYFEHQACIGIDVNSKFENTPGNKNLKAIKKFVDDLRSGF